jgi:sulfate adenylyltransferase subunit 1
VKNEFDAMVCWMTDQPLELNRKYAIKHTSRSTRAMVSKIQHRVNIHTLEHEDATTLNLNDIGRITIKTMTPLVFDAYRRNRYTGGIIIVDEATNQTVAAGMIQEPTKPVPLPEYEGYTI